MDTAAQWHQLGLVRPMEEIASTNANTPVTARPQLMERRARPQKEKALNCPRCNSTNTKFCYYNNYSLTQPRYFCKTCRRYWTEGGSLRNVPVGGGSRKNKRPSSSTATATSNSATTNTTGTAIATTTNNSSLTTVSCSSVISNSRNKLLHEGQDLNLAFPHHSIPEFSFPSLESSTVCNTNTGNNSTNTGTYTIGALSAMELLRSGVGSGLGPTFVPMTIPEYATGFGLHEFRPPPTLGFSLDGHINSGSTSGVGSGFVGIHGVQESGGNSRLLFPFEDLKPVVSSTPGVFEQSNKEQGGDTPVFWNAMIGGGGTGGAVGGGGGSW